MSVTSVEDLEALPVGQVISVKKSLNENPDDWAKQENGTWRLAGSADSVIGLGSNMFQGHATEGWITVGATVIPVAISQWRQGRSYWYWVLQDQGEGRWLTMRFRRSQSTSPMIHAVRVGEYELLSQAPEIQPHHWQHALWMMWERSEAERTARERDAEQTRVQLKNRVDPAPLHPALAQIRASVDAMERAITAGAPVANLDF